MSILSSIKFILCLTGSTCLLLSKPLLAGSTISTISVKVTVLAPLPCIINGNKPIEVDFGDEVMTTRIDGSNYRTPVRYSITCNGTPPKNGMRLRIAGAATGFNSQLLKTNFSELGIRFFYNDVSLALNSWQNFTYPEMPKLEAVPVKQTNTTLPTGEFTAAATLHVDYQ